MSAPAEFGRALVRFPRPNPLVVLWRWRYEAGLVLAAVLLAARVGPFWTVLDLVALATSVWLGPVRRRVWCVVTPHRVRTGCKHAWVHSRSGRIPAVLWTRPVDGGEEVLLWLRPGITAGDLAAAAPLLAAACWAREVRVAPDPVHAQLARLTVLRR